MSQKKLLWITRVVVAFAVLVAGLYWKRANNLGAALSIVLGLVVWIAMEFIAPEAALPPQFAGLIASALGRGAGSLLVHNPSVKCRKILHFGLGK